MKNFLTLVLLTISLIGVAQKDHEQCRYVINGGYPFDGYGYPDTLMAICVFHPTDTTISAFVITPDQTQIIFTIPSSPQPYGTPYIIPGVSLLSGSVTFDGLALTKDYVIPHGLGFTPSAIHIQPTSDDSSDNSWISAIDGTDFTITFQMNPPTGSDNLSFSWVAYR